MENQRNEDVKSKDLKQKAKFKDTIFILCTITFIIFFLYLFHDVSKSNDREYKQKLENSMNKYNSGEEMTKEEYERVKDFKEYQDKHSKKTYNDWSKN